MFTLLIVLIVHYLGLYRTINLILSIILQIVASEATGSLTVEEDRDYKVTQGKAVISINVPDPEPLAEDAKKCLDMENLRDVLYKIAKETEPRVRYVLKSRNLSF